MLRATSLVAFLALFVLTTAELYFDAGSGDTVMFTEGEETIFVMSSDSALPSVSPSSLYSATVGSVLPTSGGLYNYSITISSRGGVGSSDLVVTSGEESITASVIVAGVVILDSEGKIISGDDGEGGSIGESGTKSYEYKAVGTDGSTFSISSATVASTSSYMEVDTASTGFSGSSFVIYINQYRYGAGSFTLDIDVSEIMLGGEHFETSLKLSQNVPSSPPCVVVGKEYPISGGMVSIEMFNLLSPPQSVPVSEVVLMIGSSSYSWDQGASDLSSPDQMVKFSVSSSGDASITCDGQDAEVIGGDLVITGTPVASTETPVAPELADGMETDAPEPSEGYEGLTAKVKVVDGSIDTFPKANATSILSKCCEIIGSDNCVVTEVTSGSVILDIYGNVQDGSSSQSDLEDCFGDCSCQEDLGYACDKLTLENVELKAGAGPAVAGSTGLALWTIILIAGLGAFALITLIMLGLLAVYRRSAEHSESGYSSSGPLGVPDPSDLLYEQSIVRDIYGRGDFPEGGPSAAVAEQRQREANLREEFPRPPTSTSLSRDDASSTYTL